MSTTRSTRELAPRYTVVGTGVVQRDQSMPALILLNRSSRFLRHDLIGELVRLGYREIISVEASDRSYTVEALSQAYPGVRFVLLTDPLSVGAQINLAMRLICSPWVLVQWSTIAPPRSLRRALSLIKEPRAVCVTPFVRDTQGTKLPFLSAPAMERDTLRILNLPLCSERALTLYPYDYVGLYDREAFLGIGGFDEQIPRAYWQKLDFGFRCAMWGWTITVTTSFRMTYRSRPEPEDQSTSPEYARFFAKNLAVEIEQGHATVPWTKMVAFSWRSRFGLWRARTVFREARRWVEEHMDRFTRDARMVVAQWGDEDE